MTQPGLPLRLISLIEEYLSEPGPFSREFTIKLVEVAYRLGQNDGLMSALGELEQPGSKP